VLGFTDDEVDEGGGRVTAGEVLLGLGNGVASLDGDGFGGAGTVGSGMAKNTSSSSSVKKDVEAELLVLEELETEELEGFAVTGGALGLGEGELYWNTLALPRSGDWRMEGFPGSALISTALPGIGLELIGLGNSEATCWSGCLCPDVARLVSGLGD
jgi:hypothetical protein